MPWFVLIEAPVVGHAGRVGHRARGNYGEQCKLLSWRKVDAGAEGGSRTRTSFRTTDFKSAASAIPPPRHVIRTRIVPRLLFLFEADPAVTSEYVVASVFAQFRLIPPGPFPGAT